MKDLLSNWKLEKIDITSHQPDIFKITSGGKSFYLKKRNQTSFSERMEEYRITKYLISSGIPVETPLLTKKGETFIVTDGSFYSLYASLEGISVHNSKLITCDQFFSLGEYLAKCHLTLKKCPFNDETAVWDVYGYLKSWLSVRTLELNEWAKRVYGVIQPYEILYRRLPGQLVHSDVHLRNILWRENRVSGLLDFERIRQSPRVADLSYFITSILRETGRTRGNNPPFKKIHQFLKGYSRYQKLSDDEILSIPPLVIVFLLQYTLFYSHKGFVQAADYCVKSIDYLIKNKEYLKGLSDL